MFKLGQFVQGEWVEYSHAAAFERQTMNDGSLRLKVGVPAGDVEVPRQLTRCMEPPYEILYVLHTSRGEGDMGRYQSPPIERAEFDAFLSRYQAYLRADGRFALWIYTPQAMLVWDHHNLLYATVLCPPLRTRSDRWALGPAGCRSLFRTSTVTVRSAMPTQPQSWRISTGAARSSGPATTTSYANLRAARRLSASATITSTMPGMNTTVAIAG